ncbi:MAG: adenosylcobinamide-GDP ribazoletransferase [Deltaproteobacteria bacterium]|jgi:adenosylcobinamide-GDP ribazoletransferase|nr:adenosylcobinamide-GDP ribazoletransferase [Deltaproteobacteria bacterium]MBT4526584.1 adenosylcobinamide-GDP ribazoletransferase [Deltaproteobacteria bacterium]
MFNGLTTAVNTLTRLPFPGKNSKNFADSLAWFPLVGAILAGILWGEVKFIQFLSVQSWFEGTALLLVVTSTLLTRGLHLDGVADWADAFWGGYTVEKRLAIMKDSQLGTFGVLALILIISMKWVAYIRIIEFNALPLIFVALVISRMMQVEMAVTLPYARIDGTGAPFIKNAGNKHRFFSYIWGLGLLILLVGIYAVGFLLISIFVTYLLKKYYQKMVGGVTGDLLGVTNELIECTLLLIPMFFIEKLDIQQFFFITLF